jgi:hypothetical protein
MLNILIMIIYIQNKVKNFLSGSGKEQAKITEIKVSDSGALIREESFKAYFNQWKNSKACRKLLDELYGNFLNGEPLAGSAMDFSQHISPGANGFSVSVARPDQVPDIDDFRYLMDLFREKVVAMKYRPYSSTFEERTLADKIIRKERHYLKPWSGSTEMPMEQLYGNVLIELDIVNDEVEQLKLLATYYTGFDYREPRSFDELINSLLK